MRIPCETQLTNQSFNSEFIEFVWRFDNTELVCQFRKDKSVYFECGKVNEAGDFINDPPEIARLYPHYNYFGKGIPTQPLDAGWLKKLEDLGEDVVSYLSDL